MVWKCLEPLLPHLRPFWARWLRIGRIYFPRNCWSLCDIWHDMRHIGFPQGPGVHLPFVLEMRQKQSYHFNLAGHKFHKSSHRDQVVLLSMQSNSDFSRMRSEKFSFYFGGLGVETCCCFCVRNHSQLCEGPRAVPMGSAAKAVTWRTSTILLQGFQKRTLICRGRRSILDMWCCLFLRITLSVQIVWQAWDIENVISRGKCSGTLYSLHFTLHTLRSTLYTPHCTLDTPHFTLYTQHATLCTSHFKLHTLHSTLHTLRSILHTLHFTLYTQHAPLCTLHHTTLHTLHLTLHTLHFTLYRPHATLCTSHFHFTIHTLHHSSHSPLHALHLTLHTSQSPLHTLHAHSPLNTPLSSHSTLRTPPRSTLHSLHW